VGTVRRQRQLASAATAGAIQESSQSLDTAVRTTFFQSLNIGTLHTCLNGVSAAVRSIAGSDLPTAVNALTAASPACKTLDGSDGGLSYPFDFPDPYILPVGTEYYGFATNSAAGNIQIIESADLSNWTTVGNALPKEPAWATPGATWAPSVLQRGSTFVLYYSTIYAATGQQCISEAVANQATGPYVDSSAAPLECQVNLGGSIDPSPFVGADGSPYLVWKSEGANGQPATLWSQQLTPDGTALVPGQPSALLTPSLAWQGGVLEGPSMVASGGQVVLFYSANNWTTTDYAVGFADCAGPLGPCTEGSPQPLLATQPDFSGPGGPSVFADAQGSLWLAFHAWLPGKVGFPNSRVLFLRPVTINAGVPQIGG
jgi:beta-xylosidase